MDTLGSSDAWILKEISGVVCQKLTVWAEGGRVDLLGDFVIYMQRNLLK